MVQRVTRRLGRLRLMGLFGLGLLVLPMGCTPANDGGAGNTPPLSNAPDGGTAGQGKFVIGVMPKQTGNPYFNACEAGARDAAKDLGDVEVLYAGPVKANSEEQSTQVDSWVTQKINAVAVACNDPSQIAPSLAAARDAGLTAITYDADADPAASKRQFFVNQADVQAIAEALVDEMVEQAGEDAKVAIVSSSSTAPNQSAWTKAMDAYIKEKHPKLTIVTTEYAGEDQVQSQQMAQNILKAYPDVKGIWGLTSRAFPAAAEAVEKAGKKGRVAVVGLGLPSEMKKYVKSGVVKTVILWDPRELGNLAVRVAHAVWKGELKPGATEFVAGPLGKKEVKGDVVLLGKPMRFDATNIDNFNF